MRGKLPSILIILLLSTLEANGNAEEVTSPNPIYADSLWISRWGRISKIDSLTGSEILDIQNAYGTRKLTIDNKRSKVWVFDESGLASYDITGNTLTAYALGDGFYWPVHLKVNENTGEVWLGLNRTIYRFGTEGDLLNTITIDYPIRAVTVDTLRNAIWVAAGSSLELYDPSGIVIDRIPLGFMQDFIFHLAFDPSMDSVWAATLTQLLRFDSSHNSAVEINTLGIAAIASDHTGYLWVAQGANLIQYDPSGSVDFELKPLSTYFLADPILHLSVNLEDGSVWVGSLLTYAHISNSAELLRKDHLNLYGGTIGSLDHYTDAAPPNLSISRPENGSTLPNNNPEIILEYSDTGIGVEPSSLQIRVNDQDFSVSCNYSADSAICTPSTPIPDGPLTLSGRIADFTGNFADSNTVGFTVDTVPPLINITAPPNGLFTNQSTITVAGSINEPATVTINDYPATLTNDYGFSMPIILEEGPNSLEWTATDLAGHVTREYRLVTLDT